MVTNTPSKDRFDKWILQEYEINCEVDMNLMNECYKDEKKIDFKSSHFINAAFYASYEKKYQFEDGETVIFRTLGVFGTLLKMNEGLLWEILN